MLAASTAALGIPAASQWVAGLSLGDDDLIKPIEKTDSHNDGPWQGKLPNGAAATFYGQFDEDRMLMARHPEWMNMKDGTYLEMGALDGYKLSNTMFMYETLGWRGVLIEPQPGCTAEIKSHRSQDTVFANASCADFMELTFDIPEDDACAATSGSDDELSDERKAAYGMKPVKVGCSPLGHMLRTAGVKKLDFWSLDVEGVELGVLQGMDWDIPVHVILVEMLPGNNAKGEAGLEEIREFLYSKGFMNGGRVVGTAGYDEVWTNPNFAADMIKADLGSQLKTGGVVINRPALEGAAGQDDDTTQQQNQQLEQAKMELVKQQQQDQQDQQDQQQQMAAFEAATDPVVKQQQQQQKQQQQAPAGDWVAGPENQQQQVKQQQAAPADLRKSIGQLEVRSTSEAKERAVIERAVKEAQAEVAKADEAMQHGQVKTSDSDAKARAQARLANYKAAKAMGNHGDGKDGGK